MTTYKFNGNKKNQKDFREVFDKTNKRANENKKVKHASR